MSSYKLMTERRAVHYPGSRVSGRFQACQGLRSWVVGSEEARLRASLRPPPKLHVRV